MSERIECQFQSSDQWIEMFPYGMTVWADEDRPVMIFKDKKEQRVLPVWMSQTDASIAVTESQPHKKNESPHQLTGRMLSALGVQLEKCFFTEVKGHQQMVELHFKGSETLKKLEARADEALSFCLNQKVKFYSTNEYIENCRQMEGEIQNNRRHVRSPLQRQRDRYLN